MISFRGDKGCEKVGCVFSGEFRIRLGCKGEIEASCCDSDIDEEQGTDNLVHVSCVVMLVVLSKLPSDCNAGWRLPCFVGNFLGNVSGDEDSEESSNEFGCECEGETESKSCCDNVAVEQETGGNTLQPLAFPGVCKNCCSVLVF